MDGLGGFLALAVVLSLTPGPDDVLVLSCALRGGPRRGAASAFGVAAGSLGWGVAAAFGLAAVVAQSAALYDGMRWAGSGYLVVLGAAPLVAQALRRHRRPVPVHAPAGPWPASAPGSSWRAFAAGLTSDLLNPKIGIFYLVAVPQFVPAGEPALQYALLLCAIDVAVATAWLLTLTWTASAAVTWFRRPAVVVWSQRTFSATLIALGLATAFGP